MPTSQLVNLKTDLKSLKFGHDRPGGGDSGEPFVQADITTGTILTTTTTSTNSRKNSTRWSTAMSKSTGLRKYNSKIKN